MRLLLWFLGGLLLAEFERRWTAPGDWRPDLRLVVLSFLLLRTARAPLGTRVAGLVLGLGAGGVAPATGWWIAGGGCAVVLLPWRSVVEVRHPIVQVAASVVCVGVLALVSRFVTDTDALGATLDGAGFTWRGAAATALAAVVCHPLLVGLSRLHPAGGLPAAPRDQPFFQEFGLRTRTRSTDPLAIWSATRRRSRMRGVCNSRLLELAVLMALAAGLLGGRLVQLQVVQHEFWEKEALLVRSRSERLPFQRGSILDRHGKVLAGTESSYELVLRFRELRRGSDLGRLLLAHFLRTGERESLRQLADRPRHYLEPFLEWTVEDYKRRRPVERRRDLCWYLSRLAGEESADRLIDRLNGADDEEPFYPLLDLHRTRVLRNIEDERTELDRLEADLGLERGALWRSMDDRIAWLDGKVRAELAARPPEQRDFLLERGLYREYESRSLGLLREVPHETIFGRRFPGLEARERFRRFYPPENDVVSMLIGAVSGAQPDECALAPRACRSLGRVAHDRCSDPRRRARDADAARTHPARGSDRERGDRALRSRAPL